MKLYNFYKGTTAKRLEEILKAEIKENSVFYFEPIANISFNEVIKKNNRFFFKKGKDTYLMFAYLKNYDTVGYKGFPKYHVCECSVKNNFTGFTYSSTMPVEIYCRNQRKVLDELKSLELCKICIRESQKGIYKYLAKGKPWYDYVIEYASSNSEFGMSVNKESGYVKMWKQISEAVREKEKFICRNCNIQLEKNRVNLEVHHIDYKKSNNHPNNLIPLCVLCHATIDSKHLSNYKSSTNLLKVDLFIKNHIEYITKKNKSSLMKWKSKKSE